MNLFYGQIGLAILAAIFTFKAAKNKTNYLWIMVFISLILNFFIPVIGLLIPAAWLYKGQLKKEELQKS